VDDDYLSIGQLARLSGLTVSALRFYDAEALLRPAWTDPINGYRWYAQAQLEDARVVASLRRVGLPLAELAVVLTKRSDHSVVHALLDRHLARLESGLADARRELARTRRLLDLPEKTMSHTHVTAPAGAFTSAIAAVRFAVGDAAAPPALQGILLDASGDDVRLVATDRYRLAVALVPGARVTGDAAAFILPVDVADVLASEESGEVEVEVEIEVDGTSVAVVAGVRRLIADVIAGDFPDYASLVPSRGATPLVLDVPALERELRAAAVERREREVDGAVYDLAVLALAADGRLSVAGADDGEEGVRVGVNREFLLQALEAAGTDQLLLDIAGPVAPLAIRRDDDDAYSLLMPVSLA
jgi:DNA polymerase-3 subunit beta